MTYSGNSPILGTGSTTPTQIDAWFAHKGPSYASYAPDNSYKPAPLLGDSLRELAEHYGLNWDLVAAQMLLESAAWQSAISRDKNNPSGYGAINSSPYASATTFASPYEGIRATVAHLLSYTRGHGEWDQYDPRQANIIEIHALGVCKVLNDLNGRWATPGTTYGAGIAALSNDLVAFAQQQGGSMAGDDPRFQWTPDTNEFGYPNAGTHGRNGQPIDLLILHITVGTDSQGWLLGGNGSSTHYLTHQDGSPRAQHVAEADAAWTPGSRDYALRSINVEVEMLHTTDWTDAIMRETARTVAPMLARHNIPAVYLGRDNGPGKRGMIGHMDVPNPNPPGSAGYCGPWGGSSCHSDPGAGFDWTTFAGYVAAELAGGSTPAPTSDALILPGNPFGPVPIVGGFRAYVETLAAARYPQDMTAAITSLYGWPQEPEYPTSTGSAQVFERAILTWTRGNLPPFDITQLRREDAPPAKEAA